MLVTRELVYGVLPEINFGSQAAQGFNDYSSWWWLLYYTGLCFSPPVFMVCTALSGFILKVAKLLFTAIP